MAMGARRADVSRDEKPTAFDAARLAYEGRIDKEQLCEILLVGRCKKDFVRRVSANGKNGKNQ
jgi:hypothetical protein